MLLFAVAYSELYGRPTVYAQAFFAEDDRRSHFDFKWNQYCWSDKHNFIACMECHVRGLTTRQLAVCPSVCLLNAWIVTKRRKFCPDFYTIRKIM